MLKRVQELSLILGFQTNSGKMEVYKWARTPPTTQKRQVPLHNVLRWNGKDILVCPPIFRYLGHIIAHSSWAQRVRDEVLAKVESDLIRYRALPLNAFERVQLLNSVLIPRWLYHTLFIPHDRMFQHIDKICLEFVAIAKGLEHNKENVYKAHNVIHINSPIKYGRLGLRQIYWAYRTRYVTLVQGLLRKPTRRLSILVAQPIERMMTPLRDYVTFLSHLGGNTALSLARA